VQEENRPTRQNDEPDDMGGAVYFRAFAVDFFPAFALLLFPLPLALLAALALNRSSHRRERVVRSRYARGPLPGHRTDAEAKVP